MPTRIKNHEIPATRKMTTPSRMPFTMHTSPSRRFLHPHGRSLSRGISKKKGRHGSNGTALLHLATWLPNPSQELALSPSWRIARKAQPWLRIHIRHSESKRSTRLSAPYFGTDEILARNSLVGREKLVLVPFGRSLVLFVPQCHHRIHPHGLPPRDIAGNEGDHAKDECNRCKGDPIGRFHFKQETGQQSAKYRGA